MVIISIGIKIIDQKVSILAGFYWKPAYSKSISSNDKETHTKKVAQVWNLELTMCIFLVPNQ